MHTEELGSIPRTPNSFRKSVFARHEHADAKPHRLFRGAPQLRFQAAALGVSRWQLLVWRHDKPKWSRKLQHSSAEFAGRSYCCDPFKQASVNKTKLQQWRIRSVRGELSKCLCGLAIFLAGET